MSLNLELMPLMNYNTLARTDVYCYEVMRFDADYSIFSQLKDLGEEFEKPHIKPMPIPPQMWVTTHANEGTEKGREDRYEEELTFVYVKYLRNLKISDESSPKNKAIKAYIDALPEETPIILMWC